MGAAAALREASIDSLDFMLDPALEEDLATVFLAVLPNSNEEALARMLRYPARLAWLSDSGLGLRLLGHRVRDRRVLSLPEAVRRMSSEAAQVFGIKDRGRIAAGQWADLMLFDPATVGRGPKERVHDLPGGGVRLTTPAVGLHGAWVDGVRVVDERGLTQGRIDRLPGKFLRELGRRWLTRRTRPPILWRRPRTRRLFYALLIISRVSSFFDRSPFAPWP